MEKQVYYQYNPWWEGEYRPEGLVERRSVLARMERRLDQEGIVLLTGLRRIGKTTLLKLFIKNMILQGIDPRSIFYVSLDDFALDKKSILDVVDDFRLIHKHSVDKKVYLFLDEVASKEKFHQQLKTLFDRQRVKIYASSSSASVLKDKQAFLTGREWVIEVCPLDFDEYLDFKGINLKERDARLKEVYFEEFLQAGGLPLYVLKGEREFLKQLVEDVIYKDVIAFHQIKNQQQVKDCFLLLMTQVGSFPSISSLSRSLGISPDTAARFLDIFEETFLIHLVPRFGKAKQMVKESKKIYAADLGIRNLYVGYKNPGRLFENYVFLKLKSFDLSYVVENKIEIDFLINREILVEVKYHEELNENQKRVFAHFPADHKFIVRDRHTLNGLITFLGEK
jgi:hypothetical protein